ncbi:MAG: DUF72 domain-containing protein [Bryobacteraceae bacterium]|nr:DUF72 domain-containing protein [Bryobacteraceae bacterium]
MPQAPNIHIGPAGWSYPHWNGVVYPEARPRGFHALHFLSEFTDLVEINTSFYQPLRPEITSVWLKKVDHNPRFLFTAMLNRRFTHERSLEPAEVAANKRGLWPLLKEGKLGCLLMQFPWAFRFTEENRAFLIKLRRTFHEFPLAAEMRHSSWMADEALGVFVDYRIGFCNLDIPQHVKTMPPTAFLTSGIAYVRLHGRNAGLGIQNFDAAPQNGQDCDYLYSAEELSEWKPRIERIARLAERTFVVTNNHGGGRAIVNALMLEELFGKTPAAVPAGLRRLYTSQLKALPVETPVQNTLFEAA